eukprot:621897-Amorphochlora_amoeboformis.AAC.1
MWNLFNRSSNSTPTPPPNPPPPPPSLPENKKEEKEKTVPAQTTPSPKPSADLKNDENQITSRLPLVLGRPAPGQVKENDGTGKEGGGGKTNPWGNIMEGMKSLMKSGTKRGTPPDEGGLPEGKGKETEGEGSKRVKRGWSLGFSMGSTKVEVCKCHLNIT